MKLQSFWRRPALPPPPAHLQGAAVLLAAVALWILLRSLADFWAAAPSTLFLLLVAGISAAYGWLAWRLPWASLGTVVAAGLIGVWAYRKSLAVYALGQALLAQWHGVLTQIHTGNYQLQFDPLFGRALLVLVGLALGLFFLWRSLGRGRGLSSLLIGTLILAAEWLQFDDAAAVQIGLFTPAILGLWAVGRMGHRRRRWTQAGRTVRYAPQTWPALLLVALVMLGMFAGPQSFRPVDATAVGNRLEQALPWLKALRDNTPGRFRFGMQYAGFSRDGNLGGPAEPDNKVAFTVKVPESPPGTLYLRGLVDSTYTGHSWTSSGRSLQELTPGGFLASQYPSLVPSQFLTMEITPADLMAPNLFSPLELASLSRGPSKVTVTRMGELLTANPVRSAYQIQARIPGFNGDQIATFGLFNKQLKQPTGGEDLRDWQANLQLPQGLSPEVARLARQVAGGRDPYGAAVAIEEYLRQTYPYNLRAPELPKGQDFVSFFLFQARTGYCTSFSSSMVVMLRTLGIPARWVEGYALPPVLGQRQADGGYLYEARNLYAHAWVEAWFPGYGWVTFDPTPRSDIPAVNRNVPVAKVVASATDPAVTSADTSPKKKNTETEPEPTGGTAGQAAGAMGWIWSGLAGVLVLAGAAFWLVRRRREQEAAQSQGQVVQSHFHRFVRLMSSYGYERGPGTTALEYAREIGQVWPSLERLATAVARDFTTLEYGRPSAALPAGCAEQARELLALARELIRHRYGNTTYYFYPLLPKRLRRRNRPLPLPELHD